MGQAEEDRYRKALEDIVRLGTTPDTEAVGTLPGGKVGRLWSVGAQERAFDEMIRVAQAALAP